MGEPPASSPTPVPFDWLTYFLSAPKHVWKTIERVAIAMFTTRATVPLGLIVALVIVVRKLESKDLRALMEATISAQWFAVLGWVMFAVAVMFGYYLFSWRERMFERELKRVEEVKERVVKGQLEMRFPEEK